MDWDSVAVGRRILSPFYHAQHYVKKDTTYKIGNYCGFPFDVDNKAHSTIGGLRELTTLNITSNTDAGETGDIAFTSTGPYTVNVGMTMALWSDVDEPIIIGKITDMTLSTIKFGGGTQCAIRAGEVLYKIGVVPLQYWHPSRVVAGMSSAHQDMPMYGYRGASEPYGIYASGATSYTGGSPKLTSAMYQGGFFVIFKTYGVENSDLPSYGAGSTFKLGTDGYKHKSTTGSGTSYQSDVFSGKYTQLYTAYSDRNTPTWNMPIFPVHFLTYPGIFSDEMKNSLTYNPANTIGTNNYFTTRTDLDIGSSANYPTSAYYTDIFTKGRAKADFINIGNNNIDKNNLGVFAAFKPQLYLCTGGAITVGGVNARGLRESG